MLQLSAAFSTEQFHLIQIDEIRFTQAQTLRLKYLDKPQISFFFYGLNLNGCYARVQHLSRPY
ncbi:hypothetical protein [Lusitaniella coriacea]|uniref:hypothetical protein n=1 Tax=Lusitaniella coriacea TaxID=1983105 RepID=UPI003CF7DE98